MLFPFRPPETISIPTLTRLGHLLAGTGAFGFRLDRTDWFGDDVLWPAPRHRGRLADSAIHRALDQGRVAHPRMTVDMLVFTPGGDGVREARRSR